MGVFHIIRLGIILLSDVSNTPEAVASDLTELVSTSDEGHSSVVANYGDDTGDQCTLGKCFTCGKTVQLYLFLISYLSTISTLGQCFRTRDLVPRPRFGWFCFELCVFGLLSVLKIDDWILLQVKITTGEISLNY